MAETDKKKPSDTGKTEAPKAEAKTGSSKLIPIITIAIVAIFCFGGGYVLARIFFSGPASAHAASAPETVPAKEHSSEKPKEKEHGKEKSAPKEHTKSSSENAASWSC